MKHKVKYVTRSIWFVEEESDRGSHDSHTTRCSKTYAVLYNGDEVDFDENEIRNFYSSTRITPGLVNHLSNELHNKWIDYKQDDNGDLRLSGKLSDYINHLP